MANHSAALKLALALLGLGLVGYILGPPLYWHITEGLAAVGRRSSGSSAFSSCPTCDCDCSSQPLLMIPEGLRNSSFADCMKHDTDVNEETEQNFVDLLTEELKLRETESLEQQKRADMSLLEAKKIMSSYQKEADKCNSGMETCEEAREKAEQALAEQKKVTAMWELRARQRGWRDSVTKTNAQSQGNVQTA